MFLAIIAEYISIFDCSNKLQFVLLLWSSHDFKTQNDNKWQLKNFCQIFLLNIFLKKSFWYEM